MARDLSIKKVLVIGSGPIIIGQAAEFDYAGTQACRALREEGVEVVLINSNPATIMTDADIADKVYIEPLTVPVVKKLIMEEKPDSILPTLGGQNALNIAMALADEGFLEEHNVRTIGTNTDTIKLAEDRLEFKNLMERINEPCAASIVVNHVNDALEFAEKIGYPVVVRPAYTLGGTGGGIANNEKELHDICSNGLRLSRVSQCLIERCIAGWKEIEYEVMRDSAGNCITVCNMENLDPVGVHTGDSIVVAPSQTLSDKEYQMLRSSALNIITALNIEGGCNVQYALNPKTIAVVGASRYSTKVGYKVVDGLLTWGYKGKIYPVNPRADKVAGFTAYKTVKDIPDEIDLAFLAVPAHIVKSVLEDCVEKKVKIVVIATSAFKEIGRGTLQDELTQYCRDHELPLIGPNLVGMGSPYLNFNCGFIPYLPIKGPVAMISQSGANLLAALGTSQKDHFGMSFFVGLGNKADVDFCEFISYAGRDENSKCLAIYIEGLDSPDAFIEACRSVDKPIVTIKVGGSKIGEKAAFAHTASENKGTNDAFYDDIFEKAGAIRATTWQEFLDISMALGMQPAPKGDNIVMITNGGGSGLLSCDHFERRGMPMHELAEISPNLAGRIRAYMPMFGSPLNPVDISGTASPVQYKGAFTQVMRDPNVHGILGSICPTAVTDVPAVTNLVIDIYETYKHLGKPFIMECQGGEECQEAIMKLRDHGIPAYPTAEQAVNAMVALYKYGQIKKKK